MKKSVKIFFIIISWSNYCLAQTIKIQNRETAEPIAYVNIALENNEGNFTSDENGLFEIPKNKKSKTLLFDAIGYEQIQIEIDKIKGTILLTPKAILLNEVVIKTSKKTVKKVGSTKANKPAHYIHEFTDEEYKPSIIAKYFELNTESENILLKTIKVKTSSPSFHPTINFRIYSKGQEGKPGETLYNENILCKVKEGDHTTQIDLSNLNIALPKEGFFIALEILVTDINKQERKYILKNIEHTHKFYYPLIKVNKTETFTDTWNNTGKDWKKNNNFSLLMELEVEE